MVLIPLETAVETQDWMAQFLLGYDEATRKAYASDLKAFMGFCQGHGVDYRYATRGTLDAFSRHETEIMGYRPATVARRLTTISGYFKYGVSEGFLDRNPMEYVRRPKVSNESQTTGLTKSEVEALIEAAKAESLEAHALILVLSLLGLRISEALNIKTSDITSERGYKVLKIVRKGGKEQTIPMNPMTARIVGSLAVERDDKLFQMNRQGAWRLVKKLAKVAIPEKADEISPHSCRHAFVTMALDAGATIRDVQHACAHADPKTTMRYDRARHDLDNHPTFLL